MSDMRKWKYQLGTIGIRLREAINNGGDDIVSCIDTLKVLIKCWNTISGFKLSREDAEIAKQWPDTIQFNIQNIENETTGIPPVEIVNYCLREFYQFCDDSRIWIALPR